ncbi:MAG: hypothetical protein AAGN66_03295, partial [Acidobacteriota bacterium]
MPNSPRRFDSPTPSKGLPVALCLTAAGLVTILFAPRLSADPGPAGDSATPASAAAAAADGPA